MTKMRELTTEREIRGRLARDLRPHRWTIRLQRQPRLDAFGRYWTPRELALLVGIVLAGGAALWAWLAR